MVEFQLENNILIQQHPPPLLQILQAEDNIAVKWRNLNCTLTPQFDENNLTACH